MNLFSKIWYFLALVIFVLVIALILLINRENFNNRLLCYPDKELKGLLCERREVTKGRNKKEKIRNIVNELLLGPIDPKLYNYFPKESKLLSVVLENKSIYLNFNRDFLLNVNENKKGKYSVYHLMIYSIINSIHLNIRGIERYYILFNGIQYEFIDNFGPINEGLTADLKILIK